MGLIRISPKEAHTRMRMILWTAALAICASGSAGLTKVVALALVGILLISMVTPQPAYAQGALLSGITGILNGLSAATAALQTFINNVMRPILESIRNASSMVQNILGALRTFFEQIVWPIAEINRIRSLVQQLIALFSGALNSLYSINVSSAQLPNPRQLETIMRNKNPGDLAALRTAFVQTYGAVPAVGEAHPQERELTDIDDAMAIDHLMMLKIADAGADGTVAAAGAIASHGLVVAPGTAAYSTAAAHIATLQGNAHIQKMIASALRQEAARLGHATMTVKRSATFTRESRSKATELNR